LKEVKLAAIKAEIRSGAYYDSAFLMQMQRSLAALPGVIDAGVIMGTDSNKELLAHIDLVSPEVEKAKPDDLVLVIRAETEAAALEALGKVDELLAHKKTATTGEHRPQSLESAVEQLPDAEWVLISVAGRYAATVARNALRLGKHVFLFSDNVSVEDEISLKQLASEKGLLVMGPDCGTAIIRGIGLGFANKVRKGPIGVVAAAGTGLQQVTSRIHQMGGGVSYGIGTGGRDLSEKVGAITFKMGIDALARDPDTQVIVLVSKPPAPRVADEVLQLARKAGKPVVVNFIARPPVARRVDNLFFAGSLDEAAQLAVELAVNPSKAIEAEDLKIDRFAAGQRYFRGLFSGGTLAYEAQYILQGYLPKVWANSPLNHDNKLANSLVSQEHTIVDLGEDEFTVGRLHPMMDNELRIRRLLEEGNDPSVAVIMLDVVIGYGSHPDPASELAPAIAKAKAAAKAAGRELEVVAVVTGTDEDPQNLNSQIDQLKAVGTWVDTSNEVVVRYAGRIVQALNQSAEAAPTAAATPIDLATLQKPLSAINVGLESFSENLVAQNVPTLQVDWRPPAGGNERLMGILERMKK
jgi:FdrA protein